MFCVRYFVFVWNLDESVLKRMLCDRNFLNIGLFLKN